MIIARLSLVALLTDHGDVVAVMISDARVRH